MCVLGGGGGGVILEKHSENCFPEPSSKGCRKPVLASEFVLECLHGGRGAICGCPRKEGTLYIASPASWKMALCDCRVDLVRVLGVGRKLECLKKMVSLAYL